MEWVNIIRKDQPTSICHRSSWKKSSVQTLPSEEGKLRLSASAHYVKPKDKLNLTIHWKIKIVFSASFFFFVPKKNCRKWKNCALICNAILVTNALSYVAAAAALPLSFYNEAARIEKEKSSSLVRAHKEIQLSWIKPSGVGHWVDERTPASQKLDKK